MLERKLPLQNQKYSVQFLSLLLILILIVFFFNLFGLVFAIPFWGTAVISDMGLFQDLNKPSAVNFLKYMQVVNQVAMFIIAPLFFVFLVDRKMWSYLSLDKWVLRNRQFFLSLMAIYAILPFVSWMGDFNQNLELPAALSGLENWMRASEEGATRTMLAFLNVDGLWAKIFNILMIGVIAGIGEELLFRGVVLRLFKNWTRSIHWAVIISAFLFSILHFQFYGFLPRFILGLVLGYSFVYTGSLWVPILLHFFNNASALIYVYATNSTDILEKDMEIYGSTNSWGIAVGSLIIVVGIFSYLRTLQLQTKVSS